MQNEITPFGANLLNLFQFARVNLYYIKNLVSSFTTSEAILLSLLNLNLLLTNISFDNVGLYQIVIFAQYKFLIFSY